MIKNNTGSTRQQPIFLKYLLALGFLIGLGIPALAQEKYVYKILADSVKITNCDSAELIIENHTQGVPGFLYNKGNGRTEFRHALIALNDSLYLFGPDTLNINKALKYIPPSTSQGPTILQAAPLINPPQPGTIEYDGNSYYITDSNSVRHDLVRSDRVYKINTGNYDPFVNDLNRSWTFQLIGWDVDYSSASDYYSTLDIRHSLVSTIDIEITIPAGAPVGTLVTVQLQDSTVYTLTVAEQPAQDVYVIGTVHVNQDVGDPTVFYVKGAAETVASTGIVTTTNTGRRLYPASFANPTLTFSIGSNTFPPNTIKIAATYTVDKKPNAHWLERSYYAG